jgi:chemotaxis protein methyltransferase WspC
MNNYFHKILTVLEEEIGLDPESVGYKYIEKSINNTILKLGQIDEKEFYKEIIINKKSLEIFIEEIVVSETWFLRNRKSFNNLKIYLNQYDVVNEKLKILSAPCSTGEEIYSIIFMLFESGISSANCNLAAWDINHLNLNKAKKAMYKKLSLKELNDTDIEKYFRKEENFYKIKDDYLQYKIDFKQINLTKKIIEINEKFDIIFCRNLLIYLNENARKILLFNLEQLIKDNGILFVGDSELNYFLNNGFDKIDNNTSTACIPSFKEKRKKTILINKQFKKEIKKDNLVINLSVDNENKTKEKNNLDLELQNLISLNHFDKAELICKENINRNKLDWKNYFWLGVIFFIKEDYNKSKDYFLKVLFLNPLEYDTLIYLSIIENREGNLEKSDLYKKRAKKIYEDNYK